MAFRYGRLLKIEGSSLIGTRIATRPGFGWGRVGAVGRNRIARRRLIVPKKRKIPMRTSSVARTMSLTVIGHGPSSAKWSSPVVPARVRY